MVGKRGWLRIVEASIAALLILGTILIISSRSPRTVESDFTELANNILEEAGQRADIRKEVLDHDASQQEGGLSKLREFIDGKTRANPRLRYQLIVCTLNNQAVCSLSTYPSDAKEGVFVAERIVSTTVDSQGFEPKIVKLYLYTVE